MRRKLLIFLLAMFAVVLAVRGAFDSSRGLAEMSRKEFYENLNSADARQRFQNVCVGSDETDLWFRNVVTFDLRDRKEHYYVALPAGSYSEVTDEILGRHIHPHNFCSFRPLLEVIFYFVFGLGVFLILLLKRAG